MMSPTDRWSYDLHSVEWEQCQVVFPEEYRVTTARMFYFVGKITVKLLNRNFLTNKKRYAILNKLITANMPALQLHIGTKLTKTAASCFITGYRVHMRVYQILANCL